MSKVTTTLEAVNLLLTATELVVSTAATAQKLAAKLKEAENENRDITEDELAGFRAEAQQALNAAKEL